MHRIYFDSHEGTETNEYRLWLDRSREDLASPHEGMKVTIHEVRD